ncbi:MAG: class I SAM-dependent rRNA methyltransferase [Smithellaceae bacterium]
MAKFTYPAIRLKKGRDAALLHGHPWVFSGAIDAVEGKPAAGDIVLAKNAAGRPAALGFFNPYTDIAFRFLTSHTETVISSDFWRRRLETACALRQKVINDRTNAYRLINAEGDGFPGLIVDVYNSILVLSVTTAGMEKQKKHIVDELSGRFQPQAIYEQSRGRSRSLEGLENHDCFLLGDAEANPVAIKENGLEFFVDFVGGQKTGFFLDQRLNREKIGALSRDAHVLNCFAYTGAFSVYCAAAGARRVVSLDISKTACAAARQNLQCNGHSAEMHPVIETDVFTYLRNTQENFDLIILDPPAFAKTKRDVGKASRGYKEINLQAIKRLVPGGVLATFSCSNFIEEDLFCRIVGGAAQDAGVNLRVLARLEAGPDHPVALGHPEGRYLKGLLLAAS